MENRRHHNRTFRHVLSIPFIYSVLIAFLILDLWLELYHRTCFPLYKIPYVQRKKYIKVDRQKLKYLNLIEKMNCMYCGYSNGLLHYASVIAGETEKYWCGIKHQENKDFIAPAHHKNFLNYNDEEAFRKLR